MRRELSWASPGDYVDVKDIAGRLERMLVFTRCSASRTLYCLPCQTALHNMGQFEMHAEKPGKHHLVSWCLKHGVPEGPGPGDVEKVKKYEQTESGL
jgi:hypothetical protein